MPSRGSVGDIPNRAITRPIGTSGARRSPSPERHPLGSKALAADDDEVVTPISRRNTTVSWGSAPGVGMLPPVGIAVGTIGPPPGSIGSPVPIGVGAPGSGQGPGLVGAPVLAPPHLGSPWTPAPAPPTAVPRPPMWQPNGNPWGQFPAVPFAER
ncbi:hypothetical protein RHS03_03398, partial [Rhizoctonia solani]